MRVWKEIPSPDDLLEVYSNYQYFIFDMDGTFLDSEVLHMTALRQVIEEFWGVQWSLKTVMEKFVGIADRDTFKLLSDSQKPIEKSLDNFLIAKRDLCQVLLDQAGKKNELVHPEMDKLIRGLKDKGKKLAIVTASEKSFLDGVLNWIEPGLFSFSLSTFDTLRTKPFPDPYLLAFEKFGEVKADEVVIFEDSPTGLQSAKASGGIVNKVEWFFH